MGLFQQKGLSELRLEAQRLKERSYQKDKDDRKRRSEANEKAKLQAYIFDQKYGSKIRKAKKAFKSGKKQFKSFGRDFNKSSGLGDFAKNYAKNYESRY